MRGWIDEMRDYLAQSAFPVSRIDLNSLMRVFECETDKHRCDAELQHQHLITSVIISALHLQATEARPFFTERPDVILPLTSCLSVTPAPLHTHIMEAPFRYRANSQNSRRDVSQRR